VLSQKNASNGPVFSSGDFLAAPTRVMPCDVLIVEDDDDAREMMSELISGEGFSPQTAVNGRDALDQLAHGLRPHVILLDLMMPVMDGFQFRARQREDPDVADIPVLVLSAAGERARHLDAAANLPKPVDFDRLIDTIRQYCTDDSAEPPAGGDLCRRQRYGRAAARRRGPPRPRARRRRL